MLAVMKLPFGDSELVQIMDAALGDVARRAGAWLVCRESCTQCCFGAFRINELDALRLEAGMEALRSSDPKLATELERRARAWIAEHGEAFPGDVRTGMLGESEAEIEEFEEFANDAACPALDPETGRCDVYAWRPMTCRVFGPPVRMGEGDELGHCELCFDGASQEDVKACEMEVPHALESKIVGELGTSGETLVAFALVR
jgi:Fe-S-cluster containining protein